MADMKLNLNLQARVADANANFSKLANTTAKATGNFKAHQKALHETSAKMHNLNKDANRASDSVLKLSNGFGSLGKVLKAGAIAGSMIMIGRAVTSFAAKHTTSAMNAIETNNLFEVSFGDMAGEVEDSLLRISEATGLNVTNLKNVSGTYNLLARSMGFNSEQASTLSLNMTQLGLDLSSLMNVPIDQVMGDLRSGLLGQSETVYKYGIDVTEAALAQEALNLGLDKSIRNMSQGEKMYLRQIVILKHTSLAHGDFARTIEQPANQLKILQMRFQTLSESIGKLFLPVLAWILPYANAVVMILNDMIVAIGRFFGINMDTKVVDNTKKIRDGFNSVKPSIGGAGNALDKVGKDLDRVGKASDKKAKKMSKNLKKNKKEVDDTSKSLKKMQSVLLGIDEINLLKQPTEDSELPDGAGAGSLPDLDDFGGKLDGISGKIGDIGASLGDSLGGIFGGLPLDAFNNGLENIKTKADELREAFYENIEMIKAKFTEWLTNTEVFGLSLMEWYELIRAKLGEVKDTLIDIGENGIPPEWIENLGVLAGVVTALATAFGLIWAVGRLGQIVDMFRMLSSFVTLGGIIGQITTAVSTFLAPLSSLATVLGISTGAFLVIIGVIASVVGAFVQLAITNKDFRASWKLVFDNVVAIIKSAWNSFLLPIFKSLGKILWWIWTDGLRPLWDVWVEIWGEISGILTDFINFLLPIIEKIIKNLGPPVSGILTMLGIAFGTLVNVALSALEWLLQNLKGIIKTVRTVFQGLYEFLSGVFTGDFKKAIGGLDKIFGAFGDSVKFIWDNVKLIFSGIIDFLVGIFTLDFEKAFGGIFKLVVGFFFGFGGVIVGFINLVVSAFNKILGLMNSFKIDIPGWIANLIGKDAGSFGFNIPLIPTIKMPPMPKLARGGYLDGGQMFIAGEFGKPELYGQHNGRSTVMPLENTDFVVAMYDAVFSAVTSAIGSDNGEKEIVLKVGSSELGRVAINSINSVTRQEGRVLLQI